MGGALVPVTAVNLISTAPPGFPNPRNRYEIIFNTQTVQGFYNLTIKPTLSDIAGNLMNQDNDNNNGEPIEDRFIRNVFLNGETLEPRHHEPRRARWRRANATTFTVTARDGLGGVDHELHRDGAVHQSSDPQAVLPPDYTFTGSDAGVHAFTVEFRTAGVQTITVGPVTGLGINPGSAQTNVVIAATANRLAMTGLCRADDRRSDGPVHASPRSTCSATWRPGSAGRCRSTTSDPLGTCRRRTRSPRPTPVRSSSTRRRCARAACSRSPRRAGHSTPATGTIDVTAATATRFELTGLPSDVVAGVAASFIVTARDQFGNQATGYTGPIAFSGTDARAGYPPTQTLRPDGPRPQGVQRDVPDGRAQTITTSDPNGIVAGASANTIVHPANSFTFTLAVNPTTVISGGVVMADVVAFDQFGNQASEVNGPVFVTTTDGAATTPANPVLVNGRGSFPITFRTPGTHSVTVTDATNPGVSASQGGITVIAIVVGRYELSVDPTVVNIGGTVTLNVRAFDQFGNPATGLSGPVNIFITDGLATLPGRTRSSRTGSGRSR